MQHHNIRTIALLRAPPSARPTPRAAAIREDAVSCSSLETHLSIQKSSIVQFFKQEGNSKEKMVMDVILRTRHYLGAWANGITLKYPFDKANRAITTTKPESLGIKTGRLCLG